jgi:hypothetical protein
LAELEADSTAADEALVEAEADEAAPAMLEDAALRLAEKPDWRDMVAEEKAVANEAEAESNEAAALPDRGAAVDAPAAVFNDPVAVAAAADTGLTVE